MFPIQRFHLQSPVDSEVESFAKVGNSASVPNAKLPATATRFPTYAEVTGTKPPANAEQNVNADWDATSGDAQILNKPSIPAAQVPSDWNATSGVARILNKPAIATAPTIYTSLSQLPTTGIVVGSRAVVQIGTSAVMEFYAVRTTHSAIYPGWICIAGTSHELDSVGNQHLTNRWYDTGFALSTLAPFRFILLYVGAEVPPQRVVTAGFASEVRVAGTTTSAFGSSLSFRLWLGTAFGDEVYDFARTSAGNLLVKVRTTRTTQELRPLRIFGTA